MQTAQLELCGLGLGASVHQQVESQVKQPAAPAAMVEVQEDAEGITLRSGAAGSCTLRFDRTTGSLCSWRAGGSGGGELLAAPLAPCLYRAPTDNDKGGSGGSSYAARWKAAGLDRLQVVPGSALVRCEESSSAGGVQVRCAFRLQPAERAGDDAAAGVEEGVGVGEVRAWAWARAAHSALLGCGSLCMPASRNPTHHRPHRLWVLAGGWRPLAVGKPAHPS